MNYIQFLLFVIYVSSALCAGSYICWRIGYPADRMNRWVYLGEALLLGSIWIYGQMMILSLVGLYRGEFLWAGVFLNFLVLFVPAHRDYLMRCLWRHINVTLIKSVVLILIGIFIFRNLYFLVDVDSHSTYLFTQKLWLSVATSLVGDAGTPILIFGPQFDAVPYGLGLAVFPDELLFPELIVVFWRLIVLLLVFGYTTYRFTEAYGLAAIMMVLFNEHFFYSGTNNWVIINSAVIALCFAAAYNFWESYHKDDNLSLVLAIVFVVHLMSNKYTIVFVFAGMLVLGLVIQRNLGAFLRAVVRNRVWGIICLGSLMVALLWYLKNWIVTGLPTFPALAGTFNAFGWTPERQAVWLRIQGPLPLAKTLKYLTFFFVWPGVVPAKYVIVMILILPLVLLLSSLRPQVDNRSVQEVSYWLVLCLVAIIGTCLAFWQDPRYYRYPIALMAFTAVVCIDYIASNVLGLKSIGAIGAGLIVLALPGYSILWQQKGGFSYPTISDNFAVLSNRLSTAQVMQERYPNSLLFSREAGTHSVELQRAAWDTDMGEGNKALSSFLLPVRPQVGLWYTNIIRWQSYPDASQSAGDLALFGISWIFRIRDGEFQIVSSREYALEAEKFNRFPDHTTWDYGFPSELVKVEY